jgi:hypothetical protein
MVAQHGYNGRNGCVHGTYQRLVALDILVSQAGESSRLPYRHRVSFACRQTTRLPARRSVPTLQPPSLSLLVIGPAATVLKAPGRLTNPEASFREENAPLSCFICWGMISWVMVLSPRPL